MSDAYVDLAKALKLKNRKKISPAGTIYSTSFRFKDEEE